MNRIPCAKCGAMILPTTARATGGVCMPCKKYPEGKPNVASWVSTVPEQRPVSRIPDEEMNLMIKGVENAFGEFMHEGTVSTICCHVCKGVIEIRALSRSAWALNCPCGKYKDTMRGL